jgi:hypothetical protein
LAENLLSSIQRRAMLEDIARIGLALGRSFAAQIMESGDAAPLPIGVKMPSIAAHNGSETATPLERLHLLERLWPGIETALVMLARSPRLVSTAQAIPTPLHRTRGGAQVAQRIGRQPHGAAAWAISSPTSSELNTSNHLQPAANRSRPLAIPSQSADPIVLESRFRADSASPINRFVGTFLAELAQEARHLAVLADFCAEADCATRAQRLAEKVGCWRARQPFAGLAPLIAQERLQLRQGIGVPPDDAASRSLLDHWRTLRRPLHFDWSGSPLLFLPALEAWHLYEIWCFLTVAHCLQRLGWLPIDSGPIHCTPEGLRLRLATGRASQLRFRRPEAATTGRSAHLILTYQPLFPSANRRRQQQKAQHLEADYVDNDIDSEIVYTSLTHDMQPDIALQWRGHLYLLDAKYRRYASRATVDTDEDERGYQALLEDVDKMHTYRDSIARETHRAVSDAWCLWPGSAAADIFAYPAPTLELPFGIAGIGALAVRPGDEPEALARLLNHWLSPDS